MGPGVDGLGVGAAGLGAGAAGLGGGGGAGFLLFCAFAVQVNASSATRIIAADTFLITWEELASS